MTTIFIKMCMSCTIGFCSGVCLQKIARPSFDGFRCCRFAFAWIRLSSSHSSVGQTSLQSLVELAAVLAAKQQQETEPESRPHQGAILIKSAHPRPSTRTGGSSRFNETGVGRPMRVWRWVVLRCSLEGGMHMHMVLACPTLTPPIHRNPGSAKGAEFSVGDCHQQCSKSRWPW